MTTDGLLGQLVARRTRNAAEGRPQPTEWLMLWEDALALWEEVGDYQWVMDTNLQARPTQILGIPVRMIHGGPYAT